MAIATGIRSMKNRVKRARTKNVSIARQPG
jgi:hypothetical protein